MHHRWPIGNKGLTYLRSARELICRCHFNDIVYGSNDISELMDWVDHRDVFSRFPSFYWRPAEGNPYWRVDQAQEYELSVSAEHSWLIGRFGH